MPNPDSQNPYQALEAEALAASPLPDGLRSADAGERMMAYIADTVIELILIPIIGGQLIIMLGLLSSSTDRNDLPMFIISVPLLISWLYSAWQESSTNQGTFGQRLMNIKVVDLDGRRVTFLQASVRYFAKYLSGIPLGLGYLVWNFTPHQQTLHDLISGCVVVSRVSESDTSR